MESEVELALNRIYDPTVSQSVRTASQAVCDQFSNRPESGHEAFVLYLNASRENRGDNLRFFALNVVDKCIRTYWNLLDITSKNQLKQDGVSLLENGTLPGGVEKKFIKNKVVSIVVELAKREWPQNWGDFMNGLQTVSIRGMTQAELVLSVLNFLIEDCSNSEFNNKLPPRRRADILKELRKSMDDLLKLCFKFLEVAYGQISSPEAIGLARATLRTLESMYAIAPLQSIVDYGLVGAVVEYAKPMPVVQNKLQKYAWGVLASFAKKAIPERSTFDTGAWLSSILFAFGADESSLPVVQPLTGQPGSTEAVWPMFALSNEQDSSKIVELQPVHDLMARTVCALLTNHIEYFVKEADENATATGLQLLLDVTLRFLCHPSFIIRNLIFPGLSALFRIVPRNTTDLKRGKAFILDNLELLLRTISDHSIRVGHPDSPNSPLWPASAFSIEAFDDTEAFLVGVHSSSLLSGNLMRIVTPLRPYNVLSFLRKRVEICCSFEKEQQQAFTVRPEQGYAYALSRDVQFFLLGHAEECNTVTSPRDSFIHATLNVLVDAVIPCIPQSIYTLFGTSSSSTENSEMHCAAREVRRMLEVLLQCNPQQSVEWLGCANALSKLGPCFGALPDGPNIWLGPALNKLFMCATFKTAKDEARQNLSVPTLAARKRGCSGLVDVCTQLSEGAASSPEIRQRLAVLLPEFCSQVISVINNAANMVQPFEKVMLYEVLVVVSNTLADSAAQQNFLREILASPLENWCSPQLTQTFQNPHEFVSRLRQVPEDPLLQNARRTLLLLLSIARHSKNPESKNPAERPFRSYWKQILPNIVAMTSCIHFLWKNKSSYQDLTSLYKEELRCLVGSKSCWSSGATGGAGAPERANGNSLWRETFEEDPSQGQSIRLNLLINLRELAYSALGSSVRYKEGGILGLPEFLPQFVQLVFTDLETMEHRHVGRLLTSTMVPLIQNCPDALWSSLLFPGCLSALGSIHNRLAISWVLLEKNHTNAEAFAIAVKRNRDTWQPVISTPVEDEDGNASSCASGTCGTCLCCQQTEIARDAAIHTLDAYFVELISSLVQAKKPLQSAVLNSDQLAAATLLSLTSCVACPDGNCCTKASNLFRAILEPVLLPLPRLHPFLVNQLFCALFGTLYEPKVRLTEATHHILLQLITSIWVFALQNNPKLPGNSVIKLVVDNNPVRPILLNVLCQIPNIQSADIEAVEKGLVDCSTEKGRKTKVKEFIQTCIYERKGGSSENDASPFGRVKLEVQDLPPLPTILMRDRQGSSWTNAENAWDLGVQALFHKQ